ncbi:TauD/TfdA family dioxygenase [Kitasatospora sp. NPDC101235]|uniref:TauD/TfdA family dioxygenase n=1 Tax=Kitasatospora sp. NPDC101235 TaxID=3364101 RepID=UPI003802AB3A
MSLRNGPGQVPRRPVEDRPAALARLGPAPNDHGLPVLLEAVDATVDPPAWAAHDTDRLRALLDRHGAVLLRGFAATPADLPRLLRPLAGDPLPYRERSTPRTPIGDGVYTSTDHPADQAIALHNENSYQSSFPALLAFHCALPAQAGGATPLADCRRVLARLDPAMVERFARRGVCYLRNHHPGVGLSWQDAFGTDDRAELSAYCARNGIEAHWRPDGGLHTRQVRPALARHPRTREDVWFNHAAFFHPDGLDPALREALRDRYPREDELPHHVTFGDGGPVPAADLAHIRAAYAAEAAVFRWRAGDVLLVDNLLAAHGREPYRGDRRVAVAMAGALDRQAVGTGHRIGGETP